MTYISAGHINKLLRAKFAPKEWAILFEVRNGTGYVKGERYADAVAMSLYPSRGLEVWGFEVKVSKSDWKSELAQPAKSAAIQRYCDRWYVVAPAGIVDKNELPSTWGLMEVNKEGDGLRTRVPAPQLTAQPLDRAFIASMFRNAHEGLEHYTTQAVLSDSAYTRGIKDGEDKYKKLYERTMQELEHVRKAGDASLKKLQLDVREFEERSGVRVNAYDGRHYGAALKALMACSNGINYEEWQTTALRRAKEPLEQILAVLAALEQEALTK